MRPIVLPLCLAWSCQQAQPAPLAAEVPVPAPPVETAYVEKVPAVSEHTLTVGTDSGVRENVRLAVEKIDGYLVAPGASFSFNTVVGQRTADRGFRIGTTLFEGVASKDLGGGVCQVSTALYVALMYGGYKILERHPHSTPRSYVPIGMDSSINWPDLDLRFENNDSHPVTIRATLKGPDLTVTLESLKAPRHVVTWWADSAPTPFETRRVQSTMAKAPHIFRKGHLGNPGLRIWEAKGFPQIQVPSTYKPVLEVWVVPL